METFVIYGPPGTGKTNFLFNIASQNKGSDLFVTFTKSGVSEIKKRMGQSCNATTLHALAYKSVGAKPDQILTDYDLVEFAAKYGYSFSFEDPATAYIQTESDVFLSQYNKNKAAFITNNDNKYRCFESELNDFMSKKGIIDFNDLLTKATLQGNFGKINRLFIDEAQDLSNLQWRFVDMLIKQCSPSEVYVAGDDDQAIYEWAGASPHGMEIFSDKYNSEVIVLKKSQRIPKTVHGLATQISSRIQERKEKPYSPNDNIGCVLRSNILRRIDFSGDTFVLYRCHAMRTEIVHYLINAGIVFDTLNGLSGPLKHPAVQSAQLWHKIKNNSNIKPTITQRAQISRYLNSGTDNIFDALDGNISGTLMNYLYRIKFDPAIEYAPSVKLSTIHGVKGKEADNVVILDDAAPSGIKSDSIDSELRVFYVGVTRSRENLTVFSGRNPIIFD